jgi:hypothetical protein
MRSKASRGSSAVRIQANGQPRARWATSVGMGALIALSTSGQALAASSWTDAAGDATFRAPGYADIIAGSVSMADGTFELTMTVAAPIPAAPAFVLPGVEELRWAIPLDLDVTTFPAGWPLGPTTEARHETLGLMAPPEGFAAVSWDGSEFTATWFDRRPLLNGDEVTATAVPFEIDGDTVHIWLDADLIGNPSSFRVGFATAAVTTELGTVVDTKRILDTTQPFYNAWP